MEIHQVLVGAVGEDAITRDALRLREALRRLGPSHIFAQHRGPGLDDVRPLEAYADLPSAAGGENLILFHYSIGEPAVDAFFARRPERLILRYHNVTPPDQFVDFDPAFAKLLEAGRERLPELAGRTLLAIADSSFNEQDLHAAGYARTAVVPILFDAARLRHARPRRPRTRRFHLPRTAADPLILFVGRLAPNKNQAGVVAAFHVLKTYHLPGAHLCLVGSTNIPAYASAVERFVAELGLPDVSFPGTLSDNELAYVYRRADVLLCLSSHEGFCVPLLEAMAFDLPIVAWDTTAVGETLGGAGILLDSPSPTVAAEAVLQVLQRPGLRSELVARGRQRLRELDPARSAELFLEKVRGLA